MSEQSNKDMSKHFYRASAADFMKIPGSPVAYWATKEAYDAFRDFPSLKKFGKPSQGLATTNNDKFLRLWFEVSLNKFVRPQNVNEESKKAGKWFACNKGGPFKKWYGNNWYIVNYENDGASICEYIDGTPNVKVKSNGRVINRDKYFLEGTTWSTVSSSSFSMRYTPPGFIFETKGAMCFPGDSGNCYFLTALGCSRVFDYLLRFISPTLDYHEGPVGKLPIVDTCKTEISKLAKQAVENARYDWNRSEISWDFLRLELLEFVANDGVLSTSWVKLKNKWDNNLSNQIDIEEKLDNVISKSYGIKDQLRPFDVEDSITFRINPKHRYGPLHSKQTYVDLQRSDFFQELICYSIGCMMGRYSLDKPGLILASQGETIQDYLAQIPSPKFMPDDDAILPLTDQEWFTDDVTNRFREFVKVVWGEDTLQENLEFVAESLCLHAIKPKKSETAMETIRRYLSTQFFADHMKTYKKRPIYWLFSSGKQKAFECLVYLHRYNEGTLSRMRTEYVTPLMGKYESQIRHIEEQQETATTAEKNKLTKALKGYQSKLNELREFDNKLKHYADRRISLDLDDGVKVNYGKFGDLLAKVKEITGKAPVTD